MVMKVDVIRYDSTKCKNLELLKEDLVLIPARFKSPTARNQETIIKGIDRQCNIMLFEF